MWRHVSFWFLITACVVVAARLGERHTWQFDLTRQQRHSLSDTAQQALEQLGPGIDIVAFVPDYPITRAALDKQLTPYLAHPSEPRLLYVDPLKEPDRAESQGMHQQGEIHLRLGGRLERLPDFTMTAFDQALNRLALRGNRWIVHLSGSGMGAIDDTPMGFGALAKRAEQLGYRMLSLDPRRIERLPDNTAALMVAGPDAPLDTATKALIGHFLAEGGRLLWLAGAAPQPWIAQALGIGRRPGVIVDADAARFGLDSPANAIVEDWPDALFPFVPSAPAVLYRAVALEHTPTGNWSLVGRLRSSARSWNETGPLSGRLRRDAEQAEQSGPLTVGLALEAGDEAPGRVLYLGTVHAFTNAHIGRLGNAELALGGVRWLTGNTTLAVDPDTPSHAVRWTPRTGALLALFLMGMLPALYLGTGLWLRLRRRRQ